MIKINGTFKLSGGYEVILDMTEEEFDALSYIKQTEILYSNIDWLAVTRNSEVDLIEADELEEL